jgi:uncharacterized protein YqjF (DUF2071 family)
MDRILDPSVRPDAPLIGYQRWDKLLFLHWEVPESALRPLVHRRLELDTFEGRAFVSITPFTVRGARLRGLPPLPPLADFDEINVRTYVRLGGADPAVWFFSLDAASGLAAAIARASLRLPYCYARTSRGSSGSQMHYRATRVVPPARATLSATWTVAGESTRASPGTLEHFLAERYLLFSRALGDRLFRLQVHHPPWPLRRADGVDVRQTLDTADGLPPLAGPPLAQYSDGVDVEFFPPAIV